MKLGDLFLPTFFSACAGAVWYFNSTHRDAKLLFPGLYHLPGYANVADQGNLTWQILGGLALAALAMGMYRWLARDPSLPPPP